MCRKKYYAIFLILIFFLSGSCTKPDKVWVTDWKTTSAMTIARAGAAIVVHNDVIYMIGGVDGKNFLSSIESTKIKKDGMLSAWKIVSELPEPRGFISAVVHKNRIYVVGGGNGDYGENLLNTVVSADVLENGGLGPWREETQKLLLPRRCSKLIKNGNQLIALGGFGGTLLDSVEYSTFGTDGKLVEWQMAKDKLTMPRYVNSVTRQGNKAFVLGGHHPRKGVGLTDVEYADLNVKPLQWQRTDAMQVGRYAFSSFSNQNNLYAAGGLSGSEYLDSIEMTSITRDNNALSWQTTTHLPLLMANFTTIVVNNRVYLLGGSSRDTYLNTVWLTDFNKDGHLGYWGSQVEREASNAKNGQKVSQSNLLNAGVVLKNINTEGYTYLLVEQKSKDKNKQVWLAAPKMEIQNNTRIRYSEGVYMSNFFSKSLNRNFESIIFVGTVEVQNE